MPVPDTLNHTPVAPASRIGILRILAALFTASLPISGASGAPVLKIVEHAVESAFVSYSMHASGHGVVNVRRCADCTQEHILRITPESRLVVDGMETTFPVGSRRKLRPVMLYYRPSDQVLTRMVLP